MEEEDHEVLKELTSFDQTKAGVKGLVDLGMTKIPRFFYHRRESLRDRLPPRTELVSNLRVPVIDFGRLGSGVGYGETVERVREAAETWGVFQIINHRVPRRTLEEMMDGIRRFHEQPSEVKRGYYSREGGKRFRYYCNGNLLTSKVANWRDSMSYGCEDGMVDPNEIPLICREELTSYMGHILELRKVLCQVLSEALGLSRDHLSGLECVETANFVCHYYPPCPEPELTLGAIRHSDPSFITILMQDNLGGLQVLYQDQWVDLPPAPDALVVNLGDMMQLITNDKFKSVEHRVTVSKTGTRVSAACFFYPSAKKKHEPFRPLGELLEPGREPVYRAVSSAEYLAYYKINGLDGNQTLPHFRANRK